MPRAHASRKNTHRLRPEGTGLFGDGAQASRTQMRRGDRQDEEKGHMDAEEVRDVEHVGFLHSETHSLTIGFGRKKETERKS